MFLGCTFVRVIPGFTHKILYGRSGAVLRGALILVVVVLVKAVATFYVILAL